MTHEDAGNYAAKHSKDSHVDSLIMEAIKQKISEGKVTCAALHGIAVKLRRTPIELGKNADLLGLKFSKCQLGLFGYGKQRKLKNVEHKLSENLSEKLGDSIKESVLDGHVTCFDCWRIAKKLSCSKLEVSSVCETLKVKISQCQLGAF